MILKLRNPLHILHSNLKTTSQSSFSLPVNTLDSTIKNLIWTGRPASPLNSYGFHDIMKKWYPWSSGQQAVGLYPRYLTVFQDAILYSQSGFIQLENKVFIRDTYWLDQHINNPLYQSKLGHFFYQYLSGTWFSLLLYYSQGYYHWFCDVLPRLYQIQEKLPPNTQFIIHKNSPQWMIKSLELLGIFSEQCYEFDGRIPLKIEHLYFTPPVAMTGDHDPEALQWVRNTLMKHTPAFTSNHLRLYISRQSATCRRITNEKILISMLISYGFQVVTAEQLTLDEQITLFSQAEWIIGPHGAGLTNMLYAPPGTKILELFEPSILRRCYYQMSAALQHYHYIGIGETLTSTSHEPNIFIPDSLVSQIQSLISNNS